MGTGEIYRELSRRLMMENSEILPRIWQAVCTEDEARVVAMLPGTASELAGRAERPLAEMEKMLDSLFKKGAVFESVRDGETVYRMPRHIVQFHDASLLWDGAPEEMNGLWVNFMDTEYVALLELVTQVKMPSFMRVIPINRTLDSQSRVLVYEDAARLIEAEDDGVKDNARREDRAGLKAATGTEIAVELDVQGEQQDKGDQ